MIGGNITAQIQVNEGNVKNLIGEVTEAWTDVQQITGWLDFSGGEAGIATYNAKIQESTHVFIADYVTLDSRIKAENSRMNIGGKIYEVILIDNPMELNRQLEILLKYTGEQNG